jgi:putative membrane protein
MTRPGALALLFLAPTAAAAHESAGAAGPGWTLSPLVVVPMALAAGSYAIGAARLWRIRGWGHGVRPASAACFAAGLLALGLALISPLHALGEQLFTAHMVEHEVLLTVAAPLLVLGRPIGGMLWGLPRPARVSVGRVLRTRAARRIWSALVDPAVATLLHATTLWIWHMPRLYEAALSDPILHWLQHLGFLVTAVLFWWSLIQRGGRRMFGVSVFYLFATALSSGFLGILLTVSPVPLYPSQSAAAAAWNLTALEDQQLAGLIMWVPGGTIYAVAALAMVALWIRYASTLGEERHGTYTR